MPLLPRCQTYGQAPPHLVYVVLEAHPRSSCTPRKTLRVTFLKIKKEKQEVKEPKPGFSTPLSSSVTLVNSSIEKTSPLAPFVNLRESCVRAHMLGVAKKPRDYYSECPRSPSSSCIPGSSRPLPRQSPKLFRKQEMHPSGCRTCHDSSFDFLRRRALPSLFQHRWHRCLPAL